ncbi:MAG: peptidase U61 [Candidatus Tectimicrobiota bacterium]|nr:MAG: peptidase U61 [Candidatus Tectomicrobia bacterium]
MPPRIFPPALQPGDAVGLAAPASPFDRRAFDAGVAALQRLGFRVRYTPRVFEVQRYLAGSDAARADELHRLFADPQVKAIFCCRGGYGAQRLLPLLDPALIRAHAKIFVGYSDLTSLLLYFYSQCRLISFHGPVVAGELSRGLAPATQRQLLGVLGGDAQAMQPPPSRLATLRVLRPGEAEGPLLGGCLSLLVCTLGTPFQPCTRGAILFLEDRGERLYAIDRMLTHLRLAGALEGVRGVVFGQHEAVAADRRQPYGLAEVLLDVLGDLEVPILCGFPAGHCRQPLTLPIGARVAIRDGRLVLCEVPVTPRPLEPERRAGR